MRIRLRVPADANGTEDSHPKTKGLLDGFLDLFRTKPAAKAAPDALPIPAPKPAPNSDKRWTACGEVRYLFTGRLCVRSEDSWHADYLFDVSVAGRLRQVRVVLPEPPITEWEREHDRRMTEASRLHLAVETLEAMLAHDPLPSTRTVAAEFIAAVPV